MASRTQRDLSAGGVILRDGASGPEVVLIATRGRVRWGLPKGAVEAGESLEEAALREVREETGLEARILAPLDPIEYWFWWGDAANRVRHHKRVELFLMVALGGDTSRHDHEVEEVRWFPLAEALRRASYASERQALAQAQERWTALAEEHPAPPTGATPAG